MSKRKMEIGTIEINRKFPSLEVASKYAKRLRGKINYASKKNGYQASVITVVSNLKKETSYLKNISNGKRGRSKRVLAMNNLMIDNWYNSNPYTDWHIHVLIVSNHSYALRNQIKNYIDSNWNDIPKIYEKEDFDISKLNKKKVYKKTCNIKIADYFIDQSAEIKFLNCNYSREKDFDYSLKDYYREYMKLRSNKSKLFKKHLKQPMIEEKYLKELIKIENNFKQVEDYFYGITKEQGDKEQRDYMEKVKLSKINENYNKVQNISRRDKFIEPSY